MKESKAMAQEILYPKTSEEFYHHKKKRRCSIQKTILIYFAIFTGKHLCWSLFLNFIKKETPTQVFSGQYCEIFKKSYFEEHL